jgi:hypothetical protein
VALERCAEGGADELDFGFVEAQDRVVADFM